MNNKIRAILAGTALLCLLAFGMNTSIVAQGRGGGRGAGAGGGRPAGVGQPSGVGVGGGLGTASERSEGRADEGLARARAARDNRQQADAEMRRNPQVADELNTTPDRLRRGYEEALAANPNLKFGQFVAANMLARNLGANNPRVTTGAILNGLAEGNSIGRTLQSLGVSKHEAEDAVRNSKHERNRRQQ